ncbi:hypothetical protein EXIGLDRAFT_485449 [Exidia glandulosa HHB12029]|uniref:Uncharacterized protein n=1 Tax=Exidia glandulosa HHB12029 TaxID=1314781 RepID=A0A165JQE4_EXIGL|nr:hypothetical protein EXIGLDRAFT_485449 [Exidia glandulosa HHB12029]
MPGTTLCFLALRTLQLVAYIPFTFEPSVGVEELVSFIGSVQIDGGVLEELVAENVAVEGDLNCLAGLIRILTCVLYL